MYLKSLAVKNFRNHEAVKYNFSNKMNIFTGPNGVGKTNLVEAIYYLSLARSFRTTDDDELIRYGQFQAHIDAKVMLGEVSHMIKVLFTPEGRKIIIDNKPVHKLSELSSLVNIILFEPKDVMLFRGLPKERRNYLDIFISK